MTRTPPQCTIHSKGHPANDAVMIALQHNAGRKPLRISLIQGSEFRVSRVVHQAVNPRRKEALPWRAGEICGACVCGQIFIVLQCGKGGVRWGGSDCMGTECSKVSQSDRTGSTSKRIDLSIFLLLRLQCGSNAHNMGRTFLSAATVKG